MRGKAGRFGQKLGERFRNLRGLLRQAGDSSFTAQTLAQGCELLQTDASESFRRINPTFEFSRRKSNSLLYMSRIFPTNCRTEQFAQRANAEFFLRARTVSLHSFQTQMQILGNLRGRASLSKEPEYFQLAIA